MQRLSRLYERASNSLFRLDALLKWSEAESVLDASIPRLDLRKASKRLEASRSVSARRLLWALLDVAVSGLSFLLAIAILDGRSAFVDGESVLFEVLVFSGIGVIVYPIAGLPLHSWRFVSIPDGFLLMRGILIANAAFIIVTLLTRRLMSQAVSVSLIAFAITMTALGGMRVFYRSLGEGGFPLG